MTTSIRVLCPDNRTRTVQLRGIGLPCPAYLIMRKRYVGGHVCRENGTLQFRVADAYRYAYEAAIRPLE